VRTILNAASSDPVPLTINARSGLTWQYGYDTMDSINPVTSLDQGFGYDNLNRLTSQTVNGSGTSYTYDATGNRTSKTIGGTTYSNTIAATSNPGTTSSHTAVTHTP